MRRFILYLWAALCFASWPSMVWAQQPSVQLESRVTGNQELPRVMYILPWRQPAEVEFDWQPEPGIAGELFQPLRRDEYLRELRYRQASSPGPQNHTEQDNPELAE
ncbi:hypothetical protein EY643_16980 [Halioglobus maricola]|uniref:Uncharacterized protein n=1 Tax=Halioglobus maricola TaxID=2601894 RepID=A0A5P9NP47_9GAMM|nr:hypothetical protein [Halioglobus maricola]QFU77215.1 hypothetical protein EY643_16980 [Halioglobus maricola]